MQSGKAPKYRSKYVKKGEPREEGEEGQGQDSPRRQRAPRFAYRRTMPSSAGRASCPSTRTASTSA